MEKLSYTYRGVVHAWQCDHMGHMNVMWYVGKFDEATWNLFAEAGLPVVLQFGETQWWYFDNQQQDPNGNADGAKKKDDVVDADFTEVKE